MVFAVKTKRNRIENKEKEEPIIANLIYKGNLLKELCKLLAKKQGKHFRILCYS